MARMRELARAGALVCGSSKTAAIQSVSPQEIAEWCQSLAACGVRGVLLASLQAAVLKQQIDGKRFDDMVNSGDLLRLGLEDLNPRLLVTIRKAWRTDFGHVCFVSHCPLVVPPSEKTSPRQNLLSNNAPPLPKVFGSARGRLDSDRCYSRDGPKGMRQTRSAGDSSCLSYVDASRCESWPPPERPDSLEDNFATRSRAQIPFAPSNHSQAAVAVVCIPLQQERDSLDALLPAKPPAPKSFAPPQPVAMSSQRMLTESEGVTLADIFAPREKALTTFAAQDQDQNNSTNGLPRKRPSNHASEWNGISLMDALKPPSHAQEHETLSARESMPRSPAIKDQPISKKGLEVWHGQGLGDVFAPKQAAPRSFASAAKKQANEVIDESVECGFAYKRELVDGFGGNSLGDVLQSAPREAVLVVGSMDSKQHRHEDQEHLQEQRRYQKPSEDIWGGASLGDALVAKAKLVPSKPKPSNDKPLGSVVTGKKSIVDYDGACQKSQQEIVEWLRSLPLSHVPEQPREEIISIVEENSMTGGDFTHFVQKVDPAVCGPKHAMKLKAAWNNVLAEAAASEVCRQNLDYAAQHSKKAVAIKISA